jgi:Ricin-type beta-trefoil lectin domain-like
VITNEDGRIVTCDVFASRPARYFFIKSQLSGLVLDIAGGSREAGTRVITYHQKGGHPDNQLWFEDRFGNIRSKLDDDLVLDASGR